MQSAQEFFESYLSEKAKSLRSFWQTQLEIHEKFFSKENFEYHSQWTETRNQNPESISAIEATDNRASIVTTAPSPRKNWRHRYQLHFSDGKWQIHAQEAECFLCKGTGQQAEKQCKICGGTGWRDYLQPKN